MFKGSVRVWTLGFGVWGFKVWGFKGLGIEDLGLSLRLYGNSCSKLSGKRPNKVTDVEWLSKLWSLLGTLNNGCRAILGTQKGTIILTTTHMHIGLWHCRLTVLPLEMVIAPSK